MEEDEYEIHAPFYEIEYLDDDNVRHLAKVKDTTYLADRFTILLNKKIDFD